MHKGKDKEISDNCRNSHFNENYIGYFTIIIAVFILYLFSVKYSFLYHNVIVPRGDPFSYSVGFFALLDILRVDYFHNFIFIVRNWYWLINFILAIISPIIIKEPYSISLVNFILFGFATASLFRLARYLNYNVSSAFLLSIILWLFPSNYGFQHPVSLMQMQLDTAFLFAVVIAVANILIYSLSIDKTSNAILAGFSVGIAVWGRGNSLPYVLICIFFPIIIILVSLVKTKEYSQRNNSLINFIMFSLLIVVMAGGFYIINWKALSGYYSAHSNVMEQQVAINYSGIKTNLIGIPGKFFSIKKPFLPFTIISHLIVLLSLFITFVNNKQIIIIIRNNLKIISATGVIIFYGVLVFNLSFFNNQIFLGVIHFHSLMLAGLTFCGFSLLASFLNIFKFKNIFRINEVVILIVISICVLSYGNYFMKKNTPLDYDISAANPREVEAFACEIDDILAKHSLAVLWHEMYNAPIINYYRLKNDLPQILFYTNEYYKDLWVAPYNPNNREKILLGIKETLTKADFIIIPEFSDSYFLRSYPLYHCIDDLVIFINSPNCPKFVVRWVLHEPGNMRILMLQKETDAINEGIENIEKLKLPYGPSNASIKSKYSLVPSDKFVPTTKYPIVEVSSQPGTHYYDRAFDHSISPDSFWEIGGKYPFWISIEYRNNIEITKYSFQTGEVPERMPTEWQLQGSSDGNNFIILDNKKNEVNWKINEKREYSISKPEEHKYYRLYITAGLTNIIRIYEIGFTTETSPSPKISERTIPTK
jgi:hypothetical protein